MITGIGYDLLNADRVIYTLSRMTTANNKHMRLLRVGLTPSMGLVALAENGHGYAIGYWLNYDSENENFYWSYGHYYEEYDGASDEYHDKTFITVWEEGQTHYME